MTLNKFLITLKIRVMILFIFTVYFLSSFILKWWISFSHSNNLLDVPDGRKKHTSATPTSGGIIFIIPPIVILFFEDFSGESLVILFAVLIIGILGFIDDKKDLSAKVKFVFQFLLSYLMIDQLGSFELFEGLSWINETWSFVLSIFLSVALMNAFNLMDGVDGLLGSYSLLTFLSFIVISYIYQSHLANFISFLMFASIFAFLRFNWRPAKVFMGDTGSLILGVVIVSTTLVLNNHSTNAVESSIMTLPIILVPLWDMIRVMLWRIASGTGPFKADRNHFHHILISLNMSAPRIVLWFVVLTVVQGVIGQFWVLIEGNVVQLIVVSAVVTMSLIELFLFIRVRKLNIKTMKSKMRSKELISSNQLVKTYFYNE